MPALLLLAVALGLDNLAAAIGFGVGGVRGGTRVRIAVVFGLFEAGMPVLGLLLAGLVLSGDNLAAGFALGAYHTNLALAAAVFGVVSVGMSLVGLELGARIGAAAGERSELVACALLIVVGAVIAAGAL